MLCLVASATQLLTAYQLLHEIRQREDAVMRRVVIELQVLQFSFRNAAIHLLLAQAERIERVRGTG